MRRPERGLTLVELLVTVAIVVLVAVVLLALLLPSADRRCRLEAERLAAYLTSTRAASIMNDAPTRAAIDLDGQRVTREDSRVGAEILHVDFHPSAEAKPFEPRKPVKLTTVLTPMAGETTSGEIWLLFNGRQTLGGVVVLGLEAAIYSVVVPPGIEGEIFVQKGKASLLTGPARPGGGINPFVALGALPALIGGEAPEALAGEGLGAGGPAPIPPLPAGGPPGEVGGDPPVEPPPAEDPGVEPEAPAEAPVDPIEEPPPPEEEPEEEPEDEGECGPERPCEGWQRICVQSQCVFSPEGLSFRAINLQIQSPPEAAPILTSVVQQAVAQGLFNLVVRLDASLDPNNLQSGFRGALFQAISGGAGFVQDPSLPSYARFYQSTGCSTDDFCLQAGPIDEDQSELRLFVHKPGPPIPNECNYFGLVVEAVVLLNVTGGMGPGDTRASMTITGAITPRRAAELVFADQGGNLVTLRDYFDDNGISPNVDVSPRDGVPDSWQFQMQGQAQVVDMLSGQPNPGVRVPRCDD